MSAFSFIANLDGEQKKKYQLFEADIGFEKLKVLIPFENADTFEEAVTKSNLKTATTMKSIALKFGGEIIE